MFDIVLESIRALITGLILGFLWWQGRRAHLRDQQGWAYVLGGSALVFLGSVIDVTDNFPAEV